MPDRLSDAFIKVQPTPPKGNRVHRDTLVKGFGCRITARDARSFVLNYTTRAGTERRYTIGSFPEWSTVAAREEAKRLKRQIDQGGDPLGDIDKLRDAPTMADLAAVYVERYLADPPGGDESKAKLRPATRRDYRYLLDKDILPRLSKRRVAEITFDDIDRLHRTITARGASYTANRAVALLHKMFNYSIRNLRWLKDNPATGIERNQEEKRKRYLTGEELARLTIALKEHPDQQAANIIRLLLLTGARRGEALSARWDQFDLEAGVWIKPGATTKQKTEHRAPISAPARQLLSEIKAAAKKDSPYVFPGRKSGHRVEIKAQWRALCKAADIVTVETVKGANGRERTVVKPSARIHDLRHTYASVLASAGLSLPVIGALLGHTQAQTTQRYAHLFEDPLRKATERAGEIIAGSDGRAGADVMPFKGGRQ